MNTNAVCAAAAFCAVLVGFSPRAQAATEAINVLFNGNTSATTVTIPQRVTGMSSGADALDQGTIWNNASPSGATLVGKVPANAAVGTYTLLSNLSLVDSGGTASNAKLSATLTVGQTNSQAELRAATPGGTPSGLLGQSVRLYNSTYDSIAFTISGLTANTAYDLYFYGSGSAAGQGLSVNLNSGYTAPGGTGSGSCTGGAAPALFDAAGSINSSGVAWFQVNAIANSAGNIVFTVPTKSGGQFLCGFQIQRAVTSSNTTYDITSYSAVGDGSTDNTLAIQSAINAANTAGGGKVVIPSGTFMSGPLTMKNNVTLNLASGATLKMLPYGTYPLSGSSYASFITCASLHDVAITGSGTIDGQGSAWWTAYSNGSLTVRRPQLVSVTNSTYVLIQGVTLKNSPNVHLPCGYSNRNVTIKNVTITAPSDSPNTDAIDFEGQDCLIQGCTFNVGDDNIAVGPGHAASGNITVQSCTFGVGHGMSIGSYCSSGLNGMCVSNSTFSGTTSGIRLKAARDRGGLVQNLVYSNLTMSGVRYPIYITSYYPSLPSSPSSDPAQAITSTTPIWQNILIKDVSSSNSASNGVCGILWGLPEKLINNVTFNHVTLSAQAGMQIYHASNINFINSSSITPSSGAALTTYDATVTGP
jgi:hypothetical protein